MKKVKNNFGFFFIYKIWQILKWVISSSTNLLFLKSISKIIGMNCIPIRLLLDNCHTCMWPAGGMIVLHNKKFQNLQQRSLLLRWFYTTRFLVCSKKSWTTWFYTVSPPSMRFFTIDKKIWTMQIRSTG